MIDKAFLLDSFEIASPLSFPCPSCTTGFLLPSDDKPRSKDSFPGFRYELDGASHSEAIDNRDPYATGVFNGMLQCNNKKCVESVAVSGKFTFNDNDQEAYRSDGRRYLIECTPLMFLPALRIFQIPKDCPKDIADDVKKSFQLFYCDQGAAANRLRSAIERFLTLLKIPRCPRDKVTKKLKRRFRLTADTRIGLLKEKQPELAAWLMAIKWIGNEGSHTGKLSKKDVITGFEMLEHVLNEHFVQHLKHLTKLRERVIKRKGKS